MRNLFLLISLLLFTGPYCFSQYILSADSSPASTEITRSWKFKKGDDPDWARPGFDDQSWDTLSGSSQLMDFDGIGWFRLKMHVDKKMRGKAVSFAITHSGASEIYLNGKYISGFGKVSSNPEEEIRHYPHAEPVIALLDSSPVQVVAIRYSNHGDKAFNGFILQVDEANRFTRMKADTSRFQTGMLALLAGSFCAFAVLHLFLFLFYRSKTSNLYYSLFTGITGILCIMVLLGVSTSSVRLIEAIDFLYEILMVAGFLSLLMLLYSLFYPSRPGYFRFFLLSGILAIFLNGFNLDQGISMVIFIGAIALEALRVIVSAIRKKADGSRIVGAGFLFFILGILLVVLIIAVLIASGLEHVELTGGVSGFLVLGLFLVSILSIPLSMSIFLARDFARTNYSLQAQLEQVKILSEKNLEQEIEKQKILEGQKEHLEVQVKLRTEEIVRQKSVIEEKNKDITDSINYAQRIQRAILPSRQAILKGLPESFVLYKPKDIVSGDFYFYAEANGKLFFAAVDCTGHGVPGAFMSMIGHNLLHQIINEKNILQPGAVLNELNESVRQALKQNELDSETRDGMDIGLCSIDLKANRVQFAGAQRPLYIIRNRELHEIKGDPYPIGGLQAGEAVQFTNYEYAVRKGDLLYLFSDGYADQFGGKEGKKFMSRRLKELLLSIQDETMPEQEILMDKIMEDWKQGREQLDDILVAGIRIT